MKNSKTNFLIKLCCSFVLILAIQSCQSNSKSGRKKMIETAMAKKEGNKRSTTPRPNTIKKDVDPKIISINTINTPEELSRIEKDLINSKIPKVQGKLIQVEGLVFKEVSQLSIKLETSPSQVVQILQLKEYVFNDVVFFSVFSFSNSKVPPCINFKLLTSLIYFSKIGFFSTFGYLVLTSNDDFPASLRPTIPVMLSESGITVSSL